MKVTAEDVNALKELMDKTLFDDEKEKYKKGLRLLKITEKEYIEYKLQGLIIKDDSINVDVRIADLPSHPIAKKIQALTKSRAKNLDVIMTDFMIVQFRFEYCMIQHLKEDVDIDKEIIRKIIMAVIKNFAKLKKRMIGDEMPESIKQHVSNLEDELKDIDEEIAEAEKKKKEEDDTNMESAMNILREAAKNAEQNDDFYYWKHGKEKIEKMYQLLMDNKPLPLIKANPQFVESFKSFEVTVQKTDWMGDIRKCFYLFKVANNSHYADEQKKERIDDFCFKLFNFPNAKNPTKKNLVNNYDEFMVKIEDKYYIEKKLSDIQRIISDLTLPKRENTGKNAG